MHRVRANLSTYIGAENNSGPNVLSVLYVAILTILCCVVLFCFLDELYDIALRQCQENRKRESETLPDTFPKVSCRRNFPTALHILGITHADAVMGPLRILGSVTVLVNKVYFRKSDISNATHA